MDQALFAILGTLVASMIWVVKRQSAQIDRSIRSLTLAVDSFRRFETTEHDAHGRIIAGLDHISATQERIADTQDRILERLNCHSEN